MSTSLFFSFVGEEGYVSPGLPGRNIGHHPLARIINHRISRDRKERAIALFREMDLKSIAHLLDVSTRSIPRCIFNFSVYGDVVPPNFPLRGRSRVYKPSDLDRFAKFLLENPTAYLDEIPFWLCVEEGIPISISTIHRYQSMFLALQTGV